MLVRIKRQTGPEAAPYWQSFSYDGPKHVTVSAVLDALNYTDDLFDTEGKPAPRIRWECSCMQAVCGGCAMVINGRPALACETFVKDLGDEISIRPLSKFPVIRYSVLIALIVDFIHLRRKQEEQCSRNDHHGHLTEDDHDRHLFQPLFVPGTDRVAC